MESFEFTCPSCVEEGLKKGGKGTAGKKSAQNKRNVKAQGKAVAVMVQKAPAEKVEIKIEKASLVKGAPL